MTATEAAEAAQMLLDKPFPPTPLAEETLASNEDWAAIWTAPLEDPDTRILHHIGKVYAECVPAPRELVDALLDEWHGQALTATFDSPWWAGIRARRLAITASAGREDAEVAVRWPVPEQAALPRFVPADETSVDLPAIGELDEDATGHMDRFNAAHDSLGQVDDA